ncbi:hypothetical protein DINM_006503 [Dirofilaria immitis]|nr:hypothetical protein [Dirofilaria immitis]
MIRIPDTEEEFEVPPYLTLFHSYLTVSPKSTGMPCRFRQHHCTLLLFTNGLSTYLDEQDFLAEDPIVRNVAAITLFLYFIAAVVGIPANIYVLIRMKRLAKDDQEKYRNGTGIALCSMAAADLCSLLLILSQNLMQLYPQFNGDEVFMHYVCKASLEQNVNAEIYKVEEHSNECLTVIFKMESDIISDAYSNGYFYLVMAFTINTSLPRDKASTLPSSIMANAVSSLIIHRNGIIGVECLASVSRSLHPIRLYPASIISLHCLESLAPHCRMYLVILCPLLTYFYYGYFCTHQEHHKHNRTLWRWLVIALICIILNTPENMYRMVILFGMPDIHEEALHFSARMLAQALYFRKNLSKLVRVPSRFIFNAKINIPAQMLRREECRVPFIVVHGPRSIEFELKINVAGLHPENSTLIVNSQSELRTQISGLIAIRFGASKDIDNIVDAEIRTFAAVLNEMQEMDFEHTFVMRSMDPFWNQCTALLHQWNIEMVFSTDSHSLMYSKWTLYMGTKYFHRLINENSSVNYARLDYPDDAFSLALQNWFHEELQKDIKKMRQILELLCILEPINVDLAIETVAIELESAIFDEWKYLDLDELVRILTLPKYWELEELKVAARSVILDVHSKQFQKQYNEQSTGSRCAIYQDLIFSGAMDETSKPIESELEKIKKMSWKMSMVEKTVEFMEESVSQ